LPFHRPFIEEEDVQAVAGAVREGWLTHGPRCREFEESFAKAVEARRAVVVSSATAAMHLSLVALGVGEGDEVITTPFTFCSTAHVIEHVGARPTFADIEEEHLQIDPAEVERLASKRTRAILPVHYGGHPCDIRRILRLADRLGVRVVEDAAHAMGALVDGRPIGSFGAACFSFYATKNITTGEGGMVTTDDDSLADRVEMLRFHGISRDAWNRYRRGGSWAYEVMEAGFKANFTDPQAALGLVQLAKDAWMRERRTAIADRYTETFGARPELVMAPRVARAVTPAWHLYPIRLRLENLRIGRDRFIEELAEVGIGTSVHFIPLHLQPHFRDRFGLAKGDFPRSEAAFDALISLPIYPSMTDDDVSCVADWVTFLAEAHAH
jgi:dTDP-4-amino-4,6-dideoxygalactose transaminase